MTKTPRDLTRQLIVIASAVVAVVGSFIGSGAAGGTPIQDAAGGALSADATLVAPAGGAFSIWSIIYLGLIAYAVWQLFPSQRTSVRQRAVGYPVAVTLVLNAAWILSVQAGLLALSAIVIVLLLAALAYTFWLLLRSRPTSIVETVVLDGTIGLYLGWVTVATAANLTAGIQTAGFMGFGWPADLWGCTIVGVAGLVGVLLAFWSHGRIAPMLSIAWGLAWVTVSRLNGELLSTPVAIAALVAAAAVVVVTVVVRLAAARSGARPGDEARAQGGQAATAGVDA